MSLPDHLLEYPPDQEWCQDHAAPMPCLACEADQADRRYDSQRDDQEEVS